MLNRRRFAFFASVSLGLMVYVIPLHAQLGSTKIGIFEEQSDIGKVAPPGTASYDSKTDTYTITSAGVNTWFRADAFHFLWTKMSGDASLTAQIAFAPPTYDRTPNPHRKGMLMIRQMLDAGSVYVDAALHGSGLTALQYRRKTGDNTQDVELDIAAPQMLRLEKRGETLTMYLSMRGEPLHQVGASTKLHFDEPFYIGLGVTSHDMNTTEKVMFSHVRLEALLAETRPIVEYSTLQTLQVAEQGRVASVILSRPGVFESPNWMPSGNALLINENGMFWKIPLLDPLAGGTPVKFDTGKAQGCWGEHGFSPDGKWLAISCSTPGHKGPNIYIVPAEGGAARQLTHHSISFFHGWSPDGKTIVFTSIRKGHEDIYTVPAAGGTETRLTDNGINDAAEFVPDGKYLYFNSDRSGTMQIWRMHPDGGALDQVTADDHNNWYPHISPDGKSMVFLSYAKTETGLHPPMKDVALRMMGLDDGVIRTLVVLTGGQGTVDSPCWAPDGQHIAFVSNQMLPAGDAEQ
jgi:TolB protein